MTKQNKKELIAFVERFASGGWTELSDGTIEVSGSLYCYYNQLTSLPENLKVGGDLYCYNKRLTGDTPKPLAFDEFEVGDDYIYADGILSELENTKTSNGLTIYKCVFGYVASDGNHHAHGKTLRQAVTDLNFKKDKRDPDEYKDLNLDAKRSVEEVTVIYRTITGACSMGCEMFIGSNVKQKTVTLRQAITLTANQYGGKQFAGFYGVTI